MSGYVSDAQRLKVLRSVIAEAEKAVANNDFAALNNCMDFFKDPANLNAVNPAQKAMMAQAVTRFESHWTALKPADFIEKKTKAATTIAKWGAKWKLNKLKKEEAAKQEAAAIKLQSYARMLLVKQVKNNKNKMLGCFANLLNLGFAESNVIDLQEGDIQSWNQEFAALKPSTNELYSIMQAVNGCFNDVNGGTVNVCKDLAAYQVGESVDRRAYRDWLNLVLLPWAEDQGVSAELCAPVAGAPINDDADGGEDAFGGGEDFGGGEHAEGGDSVVDISMEALNAMAHKEEVSGEEGQSVVSAFENMLVGRGLTISREEVPHLSQLAQALSNALAACDNDDVQARQEAIVQWVAALGVKAFDAKKEFIYEAFKK